MVKSFRTHLTESKNFDTQHTPQDLDEGLIDFIKNTYSAIRNALINGIQKLKFGQKVKIKINVPTLAEENDIDLKSRLGYLSEYSTAMELSKVLEANNCRLTKRSKFAETAKAYNMKKAELVKLNAPASEIARQESAGKVMGQQIFKDIIVTDDLPLLTFDIELTGDTGKGVTKADLVLTITKDSQKTIVDRIMASLKAYKSSQINLANNSYISLIKNLFYDDPSMLPSKAPEFIDKFVKDFGSENHMRELYRLQNIIGTEMKAGADKAAARKTAKASHGDVIALISKIFKDHYPKHKKEINERMLKILGFDGEDDFYAAVGEAGKQKVISSRSSTELKNMIQKLMSGFNLTVERNGNTNNANILFKGIDGSIIIKANMTFADTGGKSAQGKTNAFVNFSQFLKR